MELRPSRGQLASNAKCAAGRMPKATRSDRTRRADHHVVQGQLERKKEQVEIRGLNRNCNHELKNVFKEAAIEGLESTNARNDVADTLTPRTYIWEILVEEGR
jgi:hypothetical protein